jgi:DNA-binding MarR family transcriptional regulator
MSPGRFTVMMLLYDKMEASRSRRPRRTSPRRPGVTRATITGLVDTLERDGLVTRKHDSGDRRMMLST